MEFLKDVPENKAFFLGHKKIGNLNDLLLEFRTISDEEYQHYASSDHNFFADWIVNVIKDKELAKDLRKTASKKEAINLLNTTILDYKKHAFDKVKKPEKHKVLKPKVDFEDKKPKEAADKFKDSLSILDKAIEEHRKHKEKLKDIKHEPHKTPKKDSMEVLKKAIEEHRKHKEKIKSSHEPHKTPKKDSMEVLRKAIEEHRKLKEKIKKVEYKEAEKIEVKDPEEHVVEEKHESTSFVVAGSAKKEPENEVKQEEIVKVVPQSDPKTIEMLQRIERDEVEIKEFLWKHFKWDLAKEFMYGLAIGILVGFVLAKLFQP